MQTHNLPLFVYGTLRSDRANAHVVRPYRPRIRRAHMTGTLFYVEYVEDGLRQVTVDLAMHGQQQIKGELLEFDDDQLLHALADLDQRELSFEDSALPTDKRHYVYVRTIGRYVTPSGEEGLAWVYVLVSKTYQPSVLVSTTRTGEVEFEVISIQDFDLLQKCKSLEAA